MTTANRVARLVLAAEAQGYTVRRRDNGNIDMTVLHVNGLVGYEIYFDRRGRVSAYESFCGTSSRTGNEIYRRRKLSLAQVERYFDIDWKAS